MDIKGGNARSTKLYFKQNLIYARTQIETALDRFDMLSSVSSHGLQLKNKTTRVLRVAQVTGWTQFVPGLSRYDARFVMIILSRSASTHGSATIAMLLLTFRAHVPTRSLPCRRFDLGPPDLSRWNSIPVRGGVHRLRLRDAFANQLLRNAYSIAATCRSRSG